MSRLIDAERLKRTFEACVPPVAQDYVRGFCAIVDSVSTVDAVEVVRCKDCKLWGNTIILRNGESGDCLNIGLMMPKVFFCAWGERKEVE